MPRAPRKTRAQIRAEIAAQPLTTCNPQRLRKDRAHTAPASPSAPSAFPDDHTHAPVPSVLEEAELLDALTSGATTSPTILQEAEALSDLPDAQSQLSGLFQTQAQAQPTPTPTPTPVSNRAALAAHLLRLREAESSFHAFCDLMRPLYTPPEYLSQPVPDFLHTLRSKLEHLARTPNAKLLITMPPRHLKSTHASHLLPAYFMGRNPRSEIIQVTYNADFAADFGKKVRTFFTDPTFRQIFPDAALDPSTRAVDKWATTAGGLYVAVGVGGAVTGRGANLLVIDDPIKNREEAESATYRNKVWSEYTATLSTRLLAGARTLVILTRWHPDDVAGRLMESPNWLTEGWEHVNFPAIITTDTDTEVRRNDLPTDHPLYLTREEVQALSHKDRVTRVTRQRALWPEVFPLDRLLRQRALDERDFSALYMQNPTIKGGNLIKTSWFRHYDPNPNNPLLPLPASVTPAALIIAADTAFKNSETNDPTVFQVWAATHEGDFFLIHQLRERWLFPDLKREAIRLNALYRSHALRGFYIEDKASGQSLIQELKNQSGISVIPHLMHGDKVSKTKSITPLIHGGRVFLPSKAPFLDDFIREVTEFPNSTHDDQVDCMTIALDVLSGLNLTASNSFNGPIDLSTSLFSQQLNHTRFTQQLTPTNTNRPSSNRPGSNHSTKPSAWKGWGL